MDPLIKAPLHLHGANAEAMANDEVTPGCALCAAEHTGIMTPCYLALRGHYAYIPALKGAIFVLDKHSEVTFLEMPSGRKALAVDVSSKGATARVVHEDCADAAAMQLKAMWEMGDDYAEQIDEDEPEEDIHF